MEAAINSIDTLNSSWKSLIISLKEIYQTKKALENERVIKEMEHSFLECQLAKEHALKKNHESDKRVLQKTFNFFT